MKKVTVAGGGVLGSQIAIQNAMKGNDTTIWLRSEASIGRAKPRLESAYEAIARDIDLGEKNPAYAPDGLREADGSFNAEKARAELEAAKKNLKIELDLAKAVKDADIVIECVSEDPQDKEQFYKELAPLLDKKTILLTNSSSLLPSMFAGLTGDPSKYMALHFANHIWRNNLAEAMAQPKTDPKVFEEVMDYARSIGMDPVAVRKEKGGYLLNSMLIPLLNSAMDLYVTGTGSVQDIDEAWRKGTGAPVGPFQILDIVGLKTAYNIVSQLAKMPEEIAPYHFKDIAKTLADMIEKGETFYPQQK